MADRLSDVPGAETVRRDLLVGALKYYRQFMADAGHDPQFRHELALAHFKSGVIAGRLGFATDAIREYQAAQTLLAELVKSEPNAGQTSDQLAVTHNNLALLLAGRGDVDAARRHYTAAINIQKRSAEQHADEPVFAGQLAESQANLGMLLDQTGEAAAAERRCARRWAFYARSPNRGPAKRSTPATWRLPATTSVMCCESAARAPQRAQRARP